MIKLRNYQQEVIDGIRSLLAKGVKHIMAQLPTGGGKCLAKGTEILMYDGTVKKVEDLKPSDLLMGIDSKPRRIKSVCKGTEEMFTITPVKGDPFTVNKSHILSFKISGSENESTYCGGKKYYGGDIANVELVDYLESNKTFKHRAKIWRTGVSFSKCDRYMPIDPYFLGLWLADGNSNKMSFTFHNDDVEVIDYLYQSHGNIRKEYNSENSHNYHFKVSKILLNKFKDLDLLGNKHVPHSYKTSTFENRVNLLAGIMDGDAHLQHNSFDWISVSEKLCDDVMFLCRSLGLACYKSVQKKRCVNTDVWGTYYRLNICGNTDIIPTKLKRKQAKPRIQKKDVLVTGVKSIESIGNGEYFGFELEESDRLFILGDFTVTHNTIIFSFITQNAEIKGKNVLILTDRTELLTQAGGTISKFNITPAYIKAGSKYIDYRRKVFVAMSQTLRNRVGLPEWQRWIKTHIDIIIIDEAHIQEFNYLFESGLIDNKIVIGFSATPVRSGKMRQLGLDYERMVQGPDVRELIGLGYLLNCDTYTFGSPSMDGVSVNAKTGDYSNDSMFKKFDSPTLYSGLLNNYESHTPGQKMLVFCCNVEHAIKTCESMSDAGYEVRFLASKKSPPKQPSENAKIGDIERYKERLRVYNLYEQNYAKYSGGRKSILKWFHVTPGAILVNVDILTKGFDEPSIEVIALYRATNSLALYLQMIGRGSRLFEEMPNFTVFDFGGNVDRLGKYDDIRQFSLWHEERKGEGGAPPLKECGIDSNGRDITAGGDVKKGCKRLIMASMKLCPFCGFKYPEKNAAKEVELALASVKDENGVSLKVKGFKSMDWNELKQYRDITKHKSAWLWRQLWMRGGEKELRGYASWDHWGSGATNRAVGFCRQKFS